MIIPVLVKERLYIPRAPEFEDMLNELRAKFTYHNPEYSKKKALQKWTGNTQPQIRTWMHTETNELGACLSLPRGGTQKVRFILDKFDIRPHFIDRRLSLPPVMGYTNDVVLRPDQVRLAKVMMRRENCLIRSPTSSGKCLAPETLVLLHNGQTIRADQISVGDHLMGPDGTSRTVLSCTSGYGQLYKITPKRKNTSSWICNENHILTLINTSTNNIIDISIHDYINQTKWFKRLHKLFSVGIEYKPIPVPLDPYFVGIWLGDGRKNLAFVEIANPDKEIIEFIYKFAHENLLEPVTGIYSDKCPAHRLTSHKRNHNNQRTNDVLIKLRNLFSHGLCIPPEYLYNTREIRLKLLAGLIDTDGHNASNYYEIIQKNNKLAHDIWFLGRSLGFYTSIRKKIVNGVAYNRISICGNVEELPVLIPRKKVIRTTKHNDSTHLGFTVNPIGKGNYVGWTLDGDGHFLLGDFTVTHNTETALKVVEWILTTAGPVIIIVWETELMHQWIQRIQQRFGIRENDIGIIGASKKRINPITVAMQQTLLKQGYKHSHSFGGLIADEVQRFAAPTFQKVIDIFSARYRIGISADEQRRDGKQFLIYDAFGEVADEIDKASLIDEGKIHEIVLRLVPTEFNFGIELGGQWTDWNDIPADLKNYNDFLDELGANEERNNLIWTFMEPCLKNGNTCMILTRRRAHAIYWDNRIRASGYSSGLMMGGNSEEFARTINGLRKHIIQAGVGTISKGGTGHDIPQLDRGFILVPLASNKQLFEQVLGRYRRTCEGKTEAVVYYFWDQLCYPSHKRILSRLYPETYVWVKDQFLPS